jgi:transposase
MKKHSIRIKNGNQAWREKQLTTGMDLGDRTSRYCVLGEGSGVLLEAFATTQKGLSATSSALLSCRMAIETGQHSPWVSRHLKALGHEVIVAHAQNVRLIGESTRNDDRLDAKTLARLARIDPRLLGPVRHRGEAFLRWLVLISNRNSPTGRMKTY